MWKSQWHRQSNISLACCNLFTRRNNDDISVSSYGKKGRFSSFLSINCFITMDTEKSRHICRDDDDQRTVKLTLFTNIKPQILFTHSVLTRHFQKTTW